jgi:hypothetical protein
MLFIIFTLLIFIILCLAIESIQSNSKDRATKKSPRYMARRPAQIYYPKLKKKEENVTSQADTTKVSSENSTIESQKASPPETTEIKPSSDFPCAPRINEFRRPRRAVPIKDMLNSKFNFRPERKQIERTPIPEHDEEVYRQTERLRIQRESSIAEERNRRWFTQKQFERYNKH